MTKGGALPKGFERPSGSASQEKYEEVKPSSKTITLRISKFNPSKDHAPTFLEFPVSYEKWTTVLDAILEVKNYHDHSIGVRYSCRQAMCGSCGMIINGKPRLACFTKISELDSDVVTVEPMNNFPVIRDLVVGFERMFSTHKRIKPYIIREDSEITSATKEFLQSPEDVEKYIQFAGCIKCGLCNSACPTMATDSTFIGPQALAKHTDTLRITEIRVRINVLELLMSVTVYGDVILLVPVVKYAQKALIQQWESNCYEDIC